MHPENASSQFDLYHVSPKHNRPGIEKEGLKAQETTNWGDEDSEEVRGPGVWVDSDPQPDYGEDVWGIKNAPTGKKVPGYFGQQRDEMVHDTETDSSGYSYIPHDVPVSDIKRVGHIHHNENGHPEVHWHREEDCPNAAR